MRRVQEKADERKVNAWYDSNVPHLRTKLNLHGRRGWPDQCYWLPGRPLLIEFKAFGEEPRRLQAHIHKRLIEDGYEVQAHDNCADAIAAIAARLASGTISAGSRKVPARKPRGRAIS